MVYLNTEDPVIIPLTEGIAAFKALESSNHSFLHYFHSFLVHKATTSKRQCAPSFIFDSVPGNSSGAFSHISFTSTHLYSFWKDFIPASRVFTVQLSLGALGKWKIATSTTRVLNQERR